MELHISWQIFEKCTNIKFHANPSSGSLVLRADRHRDTDRPDETLRNFANRTKMVQTTLRSYLYLSKLKYAHF